MNELRRSSTSAVQIIELRGNILEAGRAPLPKLAVTFVVFYRMLANLTAPRSRQRSTKRSCLSSTVV